MSEPELGASEGFRSICGLNGVLVRVGSGVCIPKRKKTLMGRKKSDDGQLSNPIASPR